MLTDKGKEAKKLIATHANEVLIVDFDKKTDGKPRKMRAIFYKEFADEVRHSFNPDEKGILQVWDLEKGARRFVHLNGTNTIKRVKTQETFDLNAPKEAPKEMTCDVDGTPFEDIKRFEDLQALMDELF